MNREKQFFRSAVRIRLIPANPFEMEGDFERAASSPRRRAVQ